MNNVGRNRRAIRLRGYDYSQAGAYFLTICTYDRTCIFGDVAKGEMRVNELGRVVEEEWQQSARIRSEIELDAWVIMPNHFHAIAIISADDGWAASEREGALTGRGARRKSVGALIAGFKSAATSRINSMRGTPGKAVWQRNYYEHVIRNGDSLEGIRQYIIDNPAKWGEDPENPYRRLNAG